MVEKLKTVFWLSMGFVLFFVLVPGFVSANGEEKIDNKKIIFQQEEITDLNVLYEKAKKEKKDSSPSQAILKGAKGSTEIDTISTSQLLRVTENNGVSEETYSVTYFAEPTNAQLEALAENSSTRYKDDDSYSGRISSTFYYTNTTTAGQPAVQLERASATFTILDSSVAMSNKQMWLGASGWTSGGTVSQVTGRYTVTGNYRLVYAPSNWDPIATAPYKNFGVNAQATLSRGGSTWTLYLQNQL